MKSAAKDPDSKEEPLELSAKRSSVKRRSRSAARSIASTLRATTRRRLRLQTLDRSSRSDITSGRSLQLPIYLEALEKLILPDHPIAGGGYYVIRGAQDRRNKGLYRASQLDYLRLRAKNSVSPMTTGSDSQRSRRTRSGNFSTACARDGSTSIRPSDRRPAASVTTRRVPLRSRSNR
jgi:hypothetical protein